jgi:hypothetical protein
MSDTALAGCVMWYSVNISRRLEELTKAQITEAMDAAALGWQLYQLDETKIRRAAIVKAEEK